MIMVDHAYMWGKTFVQKNLNCFQNIGAEKDFDVCDRTGRL